MKRLLLLTFLTSIFYQGYSQSDSSWTLQQCIEYAFQNQTTVKNAMIDQQIANAKVGEVRSIGMPQIKGQVQIVDNPKLQRMFLQATPQNPFFAQQVAAGQVKEGQVFALPNFFQLRSSGVANATLSQLIFDGTFLVGLQAANTYKELSEKNVTASKIEVANQVTKAYYLILINEQRLEFLNANVARLDSTVRQMRLMYEQGFIEKVDAVRMEVAYNNLLTEREKFTYLQEFSWVLLHYQMGLPIENQIGLKDKLADLKLDEGALAQTIDPHQRIEYRLMETQKKLQRLELKSIRAGYYPSLAGFGTVGYSTQDKSVWNFYNGKWYPYSMLGINLSVPIFDGLNKYYRAQQSKLTLVKTENTMTSFETTINLQVKQAEVSYRNALKSVDIQKKNLELAEEVVRVTKIKYNEGVGSSLEVVTAETDLRQAQTNYYNALYDALVAKTDYMKASGTLYQE